PQRLVEMRLHVGQRPLQAGERGVLAVGLAQVARDPDQADDAPVPVQRLLEGQAPAAAPVRVQLQFEHVLDRLAGQHPPVLLDVGRRQAGRIQLQHAPADDVLASAQAQPPHQGLVHVRVAALVVLDEEHHVRQRVEQVLQLPGRQREVDGGGLRYAPPRRRRAIHYAWLRAAGTVATPPTAPPSRRRLRSWYANPRAARNHGKGAPSGPRSRRRARRPDARPRPGTPAGATPRTPPPPPRWTG